MQAKELVKIALTSTLDTTQMFLGDLSDGDMTARAVPSANNIAWQLAHLIVAEKMLLEKELPGVNYPDVPAGIVSLGNERTGKVDPKEGYLPKAQYVDWLGKMRAATIAAVDKLSDADLDKVNTGMMAKHAPNLGSLLILIANHTLMHGGQFTVVRRKLGKPILF